jgi:nucleoside-diphosphate-sugar epimerase
MRVAVTGAGGFLGAHVVTELETNGHSVLRIRRDVVGDLVAPGSGERASALVHLAFPTDAAERRARPAATLRAVARHAAEAVMIAEQVGATQLLLASSGKVYGGPARLPIEDGSKAEPTTQLGELKRLAEEIFASAARSLGFGATVLRIFNAYGPGQPPSFLVPTVLHGITQGALTLGELDHARDWIHSTDVARAFACALDSPAAAREVRAWNVATGHAYTVRDILERLRRVGATVPEPTIEVEKLRRHEVPEERASCEGLRSRGWSPRVSLDQGLADLLAESPSSMAGRDITACRGAAATAGDAP